HLEHILAEFGELIEEQYAAVREAHLTRPGIRAAADQPRIRNRVMRRTKRAPSHERLTEWQHARDRVDLRRFEPLVEAPVRERGRQPSREHGLPAARRANHQAIMLLRTPYPEIASL